jgi:selenide,water dikinase
MADRIFQSGDAELKFGYSVTGVAQRRRLLTNAGARGGDRLLLTKPLGTGILATAIKRERLDAETTSLLVRTMRILNKDASMAMLAAGAHAATDVTGFGLLGHATSMARASGVTFRLSARAVPALPRALELLAGGVFPGGLKDNMAALAGDVLANDAPEHRLLYDPQTSGGLLVSLPAGAVATFQEALASRGPAPAAPIGEVVARGRVWIEVI